MRFDVERQFIAGPNVFLVGRTTVRNRAVGFPQKFTEASFRQITHVRFADGLVTYHADHADYAQAWAQTDKQLKRFRESVGKTPP